LCGALEPGPCRQRQCAADADASDAERRDRSDIQANVVDHEEVERLRCNCLDERPDFRGILQARGEEYIRPCRGVRLQASD